MAPKSQYDNDEQEWDQPLDNL